MNLGLILVAFLILAGAIFGIFAIAASNQTPITDSFGDTQTNTTNQTQGTIGNVTAPFTAAGGGLILVFGFFVVVIAVVFLIKAIGLSSNSGRR